MKEPITPPNAKRSNRRRIKRTILWSLFALLVILLFVYLFQRNRKQPDRYKIETVTLIDTIENRTLLTGRINPRFEVLVKPQISGIISEILMEPGQRVKQGDVIARLEVVPDMQQSASADAQLRMAHIRFDKEKENYERTRDLYEKGVVAKEEYEVATATYKSAQEELDAAQEQKDIIQTGRSRTTAKTSTTLVRATASGTLLDIPVKVGNSVIPSNAFNDGTTIATIGDMSDLLFTGQVDETVIGRLHTGMPIYIVVGALGQEVFPASIEYISPKGVSQQGITQYEIRAALHAGESPVRAGYSANAEVVLEGAYKVLGIPESCIEYEDADAYVYIVESEHPLKTTRQKVKTGVSNGITIEIKEGLKKEQRVRGLLIID